jgi:Fur family ferric uptake transcriptional regulator/Fur family peroxide stress response transcriptional regulator
MAIPAHSVARRQTQQRRIVYDTAVATNAHPTAEWIYERVRKRLPRISLGTVYRNLQLLVTQGRLRAWTRGRSVRFEADLEAHDHFVCESCGLLLDLEHQEIVMKGRRSTRWDR